jgi:hypothetical protein
MNKRCFFLMPVLTTFALVANAQITVIATGLNEPRGLAFAPGSPGSLYVTEAGSGAGTTGAIAVISGPGGASPTLSRTVIGLASTTDASGISGAAGITVAPNGIVFFIMSQSTNAMLAANPKLAPSLANQFGHIIKTTDLGGKTIATDVGDFDNTWGPANPTGIFANSASRYVVDAGSNTIDEITATGIRVVAMLPAPVAGSAAPVCVDQGPDGYLYVGTQAMGAYVATGYTPQSKIYRVPTYLSNTKLDDTYVWASGFYPISGCGFGAKSVNFFVTEYVTSSLSGPGAVVQVALNADGTAGPRTTLGGGLLSYPSSFASAGNGAIYVINHSTASVYSDGTGGGEVVRVAHN